MSLNRKARRQFEKNTRSRRTQTIGFATAGSIMASQASLVSPAVADSSIVVTSCDDSGLGTLRAAITEANLNSDATVITFALQPTCDNNTITLTNALPLIQSPIEIQGPGANLLTIDGEALASTEPIFDADEFSTSLIVAEITLKGSGIRHNSYDRGTPVTDVVRGVVIKEADEPTILLDYISSPLTSLTVENSTITNNYSSGDNGVRYMLVNNSSDFIFRNNTVVNNSFGESMIANWGNANSGQVISNTFVSNDASTTSDQDPAFWGVELFGNIIANLELNGSNMCLDATDQGANLFSANDNTVGCSTLDLTSNERSNGESKIVDYEALKLGSLDSNGGPTPTIALLKGSTAIDYYSSLPTGSLGQLPTIDQRGIERPSGSGYDVGAFEYQEPIAPPVEPVATPPLVVESACASKTLGSVLFKPNSAKLTKSGKKKLNSYVDSIVKSGYKAVTINGYTAAPSKATKAKSKFRKQLAKSRALAVENYLKSSLKKQNVNVTIKTLGVGAKNPVATNKKESGRKQNRRVEIAIN